MVDRFRPEHALEESLSSFPLIFQEEVKKLFIKIILGVWKRYKNRD
jgi:hypothetical protein